MSNEPSTTDALSRAANAAAEAGVELEDFMRAAWTAYVDARPGLREQLEELQAIAQIQDLRRRGLVGAA